MIKQQRRDIHLLMFLFVFSFAFDFKGQAGGTPAQYAMAVLNTLAFLLLGVKFRFSIRNRKVFIFALLGWVCFVLVGSFGAIYNSVPWGQYLRAVYPFVLFVEAMWVVQWVAKDIHGISALMNAMIFSSVVSFFFTIVWGYYFTGKSAVDIRYQILSPLIPFLLMTVGVDIFITKYHRTRALLILATILWTILISATRGIFFSVGVSMAFIMVAWFWNNIKQGKAVIPKSWVVGFGIVGVIGLVVSFFIYLFYPFVYSKWVYRFTEGAALVTMWTRVAAVVGQWNQLGWQPGAWLWGKGFGHGYYWAKEFIPYVFPWVRAERFYQTNLFAGEFMWMPFLYYGGIVMGTVAICILLLAIIRSFHILVGLIRARSWRSSISRYEWISALGFLCFVGQGTTANPFMSRLGALFFGLLFGLILMNWRRLNL